MKNHLRIYAKVIGFWKPCVYARDLNVADLVKWPPILEQLAAFTGGVISFDLS